MTRFVFAAVAGALIASSASATSSVRLDGRGMAYVSYRDLDLRSKEGRSNLVHRIRRAAIDVCIDPSDPMPFLGFRDRCFRAAMASGVSQMDIASR